MTVELTTRCSSEFPSLLGGLVFDTLEKDPSPIFALSKDFELTYFNPAYCEFSRQNTGETAVISKFPLGSNVLQAIQGALREFYEERFRGVLASGKPWYHDYACVSASAYREFRQGVYPLKGASGVILVNSLKIEQPISARGLVPSEPHEDKYCQPTGLITQCSNCRRTLRNDGSAIWDWIPEWVKEVSLRFSHSICPICFDYYWKTS